MSYKGRLVTCKTCGKEYSTYSQLAGHILASNPYIHKYGRRWALEYLETHNYIDTETNSAIRYRG